ncbi:MAG TPA: site-specific integrase [Candidatus Binatia bacterium]|jgi:integrase
MAVNQMSNGRWRADLRDRRRTRHRKTFDTQKEAREWQNETRHAIRKGTFVDSKTNPTVQEAGIEFLAAREDREAATHEYYKGHLDHHVFPPIGDLKMCEVDVVIIEREVRDPLVAAKKFATANKVLTTLTSFWSWAANRKYVSPEVKSPAELAERVRIPREHRRERGAKNVYTVEEIGKLIAEADSLKFMVAFSLLALGLRRQEVLAVEWTDVNSEWTALRIQRAVTHARGPGETKRVARIKETKSQAGERWLPLSPPLATLLKKWRLQCPATELGLVLPSNTGQILHPSTLYDGLKRAQAAAGVPALDVKAFRHTYATALIEGGEADPQVARLMGHADTTVTRRVYTHVFDRLEGSTVANDFAAAIFRNADKAAKT